MEYTELGNTDIEVSKLCVGCMSFGKAGTMHDWTLDEEKSADVIKHALDLGINFFDTANGYSAGARSIWGGRLGIILRVIRSLSLQRYILTREDFQGRR